MLCHMIGKSDKQNCADDSEPIFQPGDSGKQSSKACGQQPPCTARESAPEFIQEENVKSC